MELSLLICTVLLAGFVSADVSHGEGEVCLPNKIFIERKYGLCKCNSDGMGYRCIKRFDKQERGLYNYEYGHEINKFPGWGLEATSHEPTPDHEHWQPDAPRRTRDALPCKLFDQMQESMRSALPRDWNGDEHIVPGECRPGITFMMGCSTCRCNSEGTFSTCKATECGASRAAYSGRGFEATAHLPTPDHEHWQPDAPRRTRDARYFPCKMSPRIAQESMRSALPRDWNGDERIVPGECRPGITFLRGRSKCHCNSEGTFSICRMWCSEGGI